MKTPVMREQLSYLFAQSLQQSLSAQYFFLYYLVFDLRFFTELRGKREKNNVYHDFVYESTGVLGWISTVACFFRNANFKCVNKIKAMYKRSHVNVRLERGSTFTFTRDVPASILFTRVKFTCVGT